jgi:hypothetical protein
MNSSATAVCGHLEDGDVLEDCGQSSVYNIFVSREQLQQVQYEHVLFAIAVTGSYLQSSNWHGRALQKAKCSV